MRTLAQILARQAEIKVELGEIQERSEPLDTDGERADVLLAEWDELEAERKPLAERAEKLAKVAAAKVEVPAERSAPDVFVRSNRTAFEDLESVRANMVSAGDLVGRARNAIEETGKFARHMTDEAREQVTRMIDAYAEDDSRQAPLISRHLLLTGSPEYHQEFRDYHRTGQAGPLMRAAMSLTDANGGYLVPFTLDPTIILTNAGIRGNIREISSTVTIATDSWNGVTSAGVTAEWTAEGTEAADASPTFAQPTITPKKADAYVLGSYEVLADSGFASSLGRLLADAKVRLEEAAFATANTGATIPRGVVAAVAAVTASIVTSATTGALVVGDIYNLADAATPRSEDSLSFLMHKKIASKVRQFDTSGGSAFWANLGMGQPEQLLGAPVYKNSTMASAVANAALVALIGDFSEYKIVDRVGMSVIYNPLVVGANRRPTGQAGWYAFWRVGADVTNVDAFRILQLNQTAAAVALA